MSGYESLMNYYRECFSLVDCFHFNSEVSKTVFTTHMPNINGIVIPITHCGIKDNRSMKSFNSEKLRMGFIGSDEPFKGLPLLIEALEEIGMEDKWELSVWGGKAGKHPSLPIQYKGNIVPKPSKMYMKPWISWWFLLSGRRLSHWSHSKPYRMVFLSSSRTMSERRMLSRSIIRDLCIIRKMS